MSAATAEWGTIPFQRLTGEKDLEVCVEAHCNLDPAKENGTDRVVFAISHGGAPHSSVTVSTATLRSPNCSARPSPIAGAPAGRMARFLGYGFNFHPQDYPGGEITIIATIYSRNGTATTLTDPCIINNDWDADRRGSTKSIHCDPVAGNDANDGSIGSKVKSLTRAIWLARANPDAPDETATLADRHAGGATITIYPGIMTGFGGEQDWPNWHTGNQWLTVICQDGSYIERAFDGSGRQHWRNTVYPQSQFGALGAGAGTSCNIRFIAPRVLGMGGVMTVASGIKGRIWMDGLIQTSRHWSFSTRWSVRQFEDTDQPIGFDNGNADCRLYATNTIMLGTGGNGFSHWTWMRDTYISDYLGVAFQMQPRFGKVYVCNAVVSSQRAFKDVAGRADCYIPGAVISSPSPGVMRIQATTQYYFSVYGLPGFDIPCDLDTLAELVGTEYHRVDISGGAVGNNSRRPANGPGPYGFLVLAAGRIGGLPYVDLDNPTVVPGIAPGTMWVQTCTADSANTDLVHPDILYFQGDQVGTLVSNVSSDDIHWSQTFFSSNSNLREVGLINCKDGCSRELTMEFGDPATNLVDCIFVGNTITGYLSWPVQTINVEGFNFVNNVVQNGRQMTSVGNAYITNNHFCVGPSMGTNATTGEFFVGGLAATRVAPWHVTPAILDTGSAVYPTPAEWRWPGSTGTSKGVNKAVGTRDWSVPSLGSVDGNLAGTIPFTLASTASLGNVATLAGTIPFFLSGLIDDDATISGGQMNLRQTIPFTLAATAAIGMNGTLAGTIPFTLASTATLNFTGGLAQTIPFVLAATATTDDAATLAATIPFTLNATAATLELPIEGDLDSAIDFSMVSVAALGLSADLSSTIPFTLAASAFRDMEADMAGSVAFTLASVSTLSAAVAVAEPEVALPVEAQGSGGGGRGSSLLSGITFPWLRRRRRRRHTR